MNRSKTDKPIIKETVSLKTGKTTKKTGTTESLEPIKYQWWRDDDSKYQAVFNVVEAIESAQSYRHTMNIRFARLYQNMEILGFSNSLYGSPGVDTLNPQTPVTLNVVKSCVDTATSKLAKNKVLIQFLTDDGNFTQQTKAKNLTKYFESLFNQINIYPEAQSAFQDCGIFGTGCLYFCIDDDEIVVERVLSDEIVVDDAEGQYGKPRQMHRRRFVSKDLLIAEFPDKEGAIRANTPNSKDNPRANEVAANQCMVIESWHLPSSKKSKDGRYAMCINNATLQEAKYDNNYFPFAFIRWSIPPVGFWGTGLAKELVGTQFKINKLLSNIDLSQDLACVPRVYLENSSNVNVDHINNDIGAIVRYTGTKPVIETSDGMPQEIYAFLDYLYKKCYEITGISQMAANSKKTPGLDSGAALREFQDIESERFVVIGQRWEKFFLDSTRILFDLSKELYGEGKPINIKINKFVKEMNWKDIDLQEDEYTMNAYGVNFLPHTPAGKLQQVQEFVQAGIMSQDFAKSLFNFPDTGEWFDLETAQLDLIRMFIEQMLEDGKYTPPDQTMNIDVAMKMVHAAYTRARTQRGVKKKNLDLCLTFMSDCQDIITAATPPPPPAIVAPAQGAPQPVSNLLPAQGAPAPPVGIS